MPTLTTPSPDVLDLTALRRDLELHGWDALTSADAYSKPAATPAAGQCAVTSLVVQDRFGGQLLRVPLESGSHYYNQLPDGREVDLTRDQFAAYAPVGPAAERTREYLLGNASTAARYERLTSRLTLAG